MILTKDEAMEIVRANRVLYPLEYSKFTETDMENAAMLYSKALQRFTLKEVREAFVECSKYCQHAIKVSDLYAKLSGCRGREAMIYESLSKKREGGAK